MNDKVDAARPSGRFTSAMDAAKALGIASQTLHKWGRAGCPKKTADGFYDVGAIYDWAKANLNDSRANASGATVGPIGDARLRKLEVETRLLLIEEKIKKAEMIPTGDAESLIRAALMPLRDALVGLPDAMASRCNPADPEHARIALEEWRNATMRTVQRAFGEQKDDPKP